jgi:hypothetical protein
MPTSHYWTRPGVAAAARLSHVRDDPNLWCAIQAHYRDALLQKGGERLVALDDSCESLGGRLRNEKRSSKKNDTTMVCIGKEELLKVVEWKFAKGKARPALRKHLNANTDEHVRSATREGFRIVDTCDADDNDSSCNVQGAIQVIAELQGVGPATASAILSWYRPDRFAFMDDEVIECFLSDKKRDYKLSTYMMMNEKCTELAATLGKGWTPRRVGSALWTASRRLATGEDDLTVAAASAAAASGDAASETTSSIPKCRKRSEKGPAEEPKRGKRRKK